MWTVCKRYNETCCIWMWYFIDNGYFYISEKAKKIAKWGIALESLSLQNFQTCDIRVYCYQLLWNSTSITFQGDTDDSILNRVAFKSKTYKAVCNVVDKSSYPWDISAHFVDNGQLCVHSNFSQLFPSIHSCAAGIWWWNQTANVQLIQLGFRASLKVNTVISTAYYLSVPNVTASSIRQAQEWGTFASTKERIYSFQGKIIAGWQAMAPSCNR